MSETRVAVVGCGYWGPNLVRVLSNLPDVRVEMLCDLDLEKAAAAAKRNGLSSRMVRDVAEVAGNPAVEAVFVATPVRAHFEVVRGLLEAGKHVFVEKPLASTVAECRVLVDLAARKKLHLMVGHVFLFSERVRYIKRLLDAGELGQLLYVYSQRVNLGRIQNDVNALWSFAPHDVSIVNHWLGASPLSTTAWGLRCLRQPVEDVVFAKLDYPGDIGVHLHMGWMDPRKVRQMTLVGSKKMLVYDDVSSEAPIRIYDKGINELHEYFQSPESFAQFRCVTREADLLIPRVRFEEPLKTEVVHFLAVLRDGAACLSDGLTSLEVVRVLEGTQRSLDSNGVRVSLESEPSLREGEGGLSRAEASPGDASRRSRD